MNAVEINSSFYRPHRRSTYERWAASTPEDFRFAVKAPRVLTHERRLRDPAEALERFADEVAGLGDRLGVLLVAVACEPRHASWFTPDVDAWMAHRRIARVAADPAPAPGAGEPGGWRGLTYVRLHGSPRIYYSAYAPEVLAATAERIAREAAPTWCVFDNTAEGCALPDALTVMAALGDEPR